MTALRLGRPFVGGDPVTFEPVYGPLHLYFDTWARNEGTVPLDLLLDDVPEGSQTTVSQCVAWAADLACVQRAPVGGIEWHESHAHFHFQDFARYELRRVRHNGQVDYTRHGLLAASDKVSFCLIDSWKLRDDALPVQRYSTCTAAQQGISPGWADIYYDGLDGQKFPVEGLPDGRYALVVAQNRSGKLFESTIADNRVEVILQLSGGTTQVSIVERRW